jgi:hypothetical protein
MTCLARIFAKAGDRTTRKFSNNSDPNQNVREKAAAPYTARPRSIVTKPGDNSGYSPYLPAAGLYSLFSDSFGPVP